MKQVLTDRFGSALAFAHQLHRNQKRKTSGAPYISHLLGVASLVLEYGGTEDDAIAALLHDSLEDQARHFPGGYPALADEIAQRFGAEVLRIVEGCTERESAAERAISDRRERWRAHRQAYIDQIRASDASVRLVSCADSLHNVGSMIRDYRRLGDALWDRFLTRRGEDQIWAYSSIARAMIEAGAGPIAAELSLAVEELARLSGHPSER